MTISKLYELVLNQLSTDLFHCLFDFTFIIFLKCFFNVLMAYGKKYLKSIPDAVARRINVSC